MTCRRCPEGRRFASGMTYCRFYGIIIRDDHDCRLEKGLEHERNGYFRHEGYDGPRVRENGGWFAGGVPEGLDAGDGSGIPESEEGRAEG